MTDEEVLQRHRDIAAGAGGDVRLSAATVSLILRLQAELRAPAGNRAADELRGEG